MNASTKTTAVRRPARYATAVALAVTMAAGCGGDGDGGGDNDDATAPPTIRGPEPAASLAQLLDHVPGDTLVLEAIDLAAAKRDLGLPADADPSVSVERPRELDTLEATAAAALDELTNHTLSPASRALDFPQATAAVSTDSFRTGGVVLIATPQPATEIARGLRRAGLAQVATDIFAVDPASEARPLGSNTHVAFGPGFVAFTESIGLARATLNRDGPDPTFAVAREHLDSVAGARRALKIVAGNGDEDFDAECVRLAVGGERLDASTQDLVLLLSETPDRKRVVVGNRRLTRGTDAEFYALRGAAVKGRALRLKVGSNHRGSESGADAAGSRSRDFYRCKGLPPRPSSADAPEDPSESYIEESAESLITLRSSASTRVEVTCPSDHGNPNQTMRCSGTRRDAGRLYHYDVVLKFDDGALSEIKSIGVTSPDDKTGTIMDDR